VGRVSNHDVFFIYKIHVLKLEHTIPSINRILLYNNSTANNIVIITLQVLCNPADKIHIPVHLIFLL